MGRGGTDLLWSSGITCTSGALGRHSEIWKKFYFLCGTELSRTATVLCPQHFIIFCFLHSTCTHYNHQGYRDKPYGQLVSVSLMHYCTSTPSLSTSWSRTTLQRAQGSGKSHLKASFPLRCFQRLSLPNLATRQCHWRDNRYTRGSSTPVLSY